MKLQKGEPIVPFRLVKFFSLTSLVVILVSTLILIVFISNRAKTELLRKSEQYARLVADNLNHQVFLQFVLPTLIQFEKIQLSNPVQFERMDKVIRNTIHGFKIDKVDVYDNKGIIAYSTDRSLVGLKGHAGRNFQLALQGKSSSALFSRGNFLGFELSGLAKQRTLKTYIPLRLEKPLSSEYGPILGVFEITQDISDDYEAITRLQYIIIGSSVGIMSLLFVILRLIVKRAERIIVRRTEERRRLEEQLHQAERMASLGEMVAAVSHEIRNPLGIIHSTSELLLQKMDDQDPKKRLGSIIMEETSRLATIVTDFLDFARPMKPNLSDCQVDEIIEKNLTFLEVEFSRRRIRVERQLATNGTVVQADADLLYRAFLNVFVNAMEAVPDGGLIRVVTHYGSSAENNLEVVISDNGPGIPEELQRKVFDPFFTTRVKGSGLGLSIVRNIVETHGGSVRLESPVQGNSEGNGPGGTAVIIALPLPTTKSR
ncbi:MAG: two-component sensor histidine kinase [Deltaproteobacteria bacterium]|nr:two-component sensor histidine kinase [Deltaproteobacteria bacterium]MBW2070153.1 two-component sensor histidine kinase [Deltaproteobacteria bacterium]